MSNVYKTYYHPKFPISRVLEAIITAKGNGPLWESWRIQPWPNWESPRKAEFLKALLDSIRKGGVTKPILLWDYAVVRGGTRLMASRALGLRTVPVLLSLREGLGDAPDGAVELAQISHPAILGHEPDVIVWRKDQPLYLSYPAWNWRSGSEPPSATAPSDGTIPLNSPPSAA